MDHQLAWYVFEFKTNNDYSQFCQLAKLMVENLKPPDVVMTKDDLKPILSLAQNNKERELIRYTLCKALGISSTAARRKFGFENTNERNKQFEEAIEDVKLINEAVDELASVKNKAVLHALGIHSSSTSSSYSSDGDNELRCL